MGGGRRVEGGPAGGASPGRRQPTRRHLTHPLPPPPPPVDPADSLDMASYALQIAIAALHVQRAHVDEGWFSVLIATQHVLMVRCGGDGGEEGRGRPPLRRRHDTHNDSAAQQRPPNNKPAKRHTPRQTHATNQTRQWTKLQYFARVFSPTKTTFIDTIRLVVRDLKWFLAFIGLTMVGFGLAFHALYRQDRSKFAVRPFGGGLKGGGR